MTDVIFDTFSVQLSPPATSGVRAPNKRNCLRADFMSSLPGESMKSKERMSLIPMESMVSTTEHKLLL